MAFKVTRTSHEIILTKEILMSINKSICASLFLVIIFVFANFVSSTEKGYSLVASRAAIKKGSTLGI